MQKKWILALAAAAATALFLQPASAHFGMLIPSANMVMPADNRTITLQLSFSHPFEMIGMTLAKPEKLTVIASGKREELLGRLQPTRVMDQRGWKANYRIQRPGAHLFYMQPQPYWEPAEDVFIIHYTKTVVAAFGDDEGWDAEIGLKTEIVPLSRPFGLYAGNLFQGIVKLDGKPVPYAAVEIEYYNKDNADKKPAAPTAYMVAQTIKADGNGVFSYAAPGAGWWGFAALSQADFTLRLESGEEKEVELGAVLWVHFEPWQQK